MGCLPLARWAAAIPVFPLTEVSGRVTKNQGVGFAFVSLRGAGSLSTHSKTGLGPPFLKLPGTTGRRHRGAGTGSGPAVGAGLRVVCSALLGESGGIRLVLES